MIKFYKNRNIYFSISLGIMILGIIFTFINGVDLDIQFKGGAILKYTYTGEVDAQAVTNTAKSVLNRDVSVQIVNDIATSENRLVLSLTGNESLSVQQQQMLEDELNKVFSENKITLSSSNTVEPYIGKRFLQNGILALIISSILIVLYVWIRFRVISGLSAGVMALVSLLHDCSVVFFTFVIFNIPINEAFIAVVLTIIGYSINDTIIIYDRIRENKRLKAKTSIEDLLDNSVNQTLTRSINTVATVVVSAVITAIFAYIYGIDSIVSFAFPMALGLITGGYSSICIAGPLWVMWQKHKLETA